MSLDFELIFERKVHDSNITHNLNVMAGEAGIYDCLWRPEENGYHRAEDIIEPLREGLRKLKDDPEYFKQFNSPNGWGTYEHFVPFVEDILESCIIFPEAKIVTSI